MCCLNILNPQSASYGINFKSNRCFPWHQLLALLFIKTHGCLLIVYFSSVPTVMVGYDSKNIFLFKEILKNHRFFLILWTYSSVVMIGLFLLITFKKKYLNILTGSEVFSKERKSSTRRPVSNANQSRLRCTWHHLKLHLHFISSLYPSNQWLPQDNLGVINYYGNCSYMCAAVQTNIGDYPYCQWPPSLGLLISTNPLPQAPPQLPKTQGYHRVKTSRNVYSNH